MEGAFTRLAFRVALPALLAGMVAPLAAQVRDQNFRAGTSLADEHPMTLGVRKFAELVEQKSASKMKTKVYSAATIGHDSQMQSALQAGTQDFACPATVTLVGMIQQFSLLDLPYLFQSTAEADAILEGPIGKRLMDKLPDKGLVGLAYMEQGFRHTTTSKRPITKWEDFKGVKIRVQPSNFYIDMFNGLGANAVPMQITEVYTAMETRVIDGHENSLAAINSNKFQDVQKYLSLTGHSYNTLILLVSKKRWDQLNADERKVLTDAADEAKTYQRKVSREQNGSLLAKLQKDGMVVNEVTLAERQRLAVQLQPVVEKYSKIIGEEWLRELNSELAKVRAKQ